MATKEMIANYMDGKRGLDAASEQADLAGDRRRRAKIDPARARTHTHAHARRLQAPRAAPRFSSRSPTRRCSRRPRATARA
jgi:hypothetical protein